MESKYENYTNTNHSNTGVAIIFNHEYIRGRQERFVMHSDKDNLSSILISYGFDVRRYEDLSFEGIENVLKKVCAEDHSQNDCLLIILMTIGYSNQLYALDKSYEIDCLLQIVSNENNKTLLNKPKLFFIQAKQLDEGVDLHSFSPANQISYQTPNASDIFLFYSNFEGPFAFKNEKIGFWFMQCIINTFEEYQNDETGVDLLDFSDCVKNKFENLYESIMQQNYKIGKLPKFVSTLTKSLKLKPRPKPKY